MPDLGRTSEIGPRGKMPDTKRRDELRRAHRYNDNDAALREQVTKLKQDLEEKFKLGENNGATLCDRVAKLKEDFEKRF